MGRLMVVSNRLPLSIEKKGEELSIRQSSGGLVSALKSYFDRPKCKQVSCRRKYGLEVWTRQKRCG
jgi:trehalose 6-phosphate synthase/phosphatase